MADIRLDNADALRSELDLPAGSDLDLLLAGYERWGDDLATHLEGPFAYVVWDARRGQASFARDRLGLRPLYLAQSPGGVVVGSSLLEVRAVVPNGVCAEAAVDHVLGRFDHPHRTFTRGIERVPAAHRGRVVARNGPPSVHMERYWSLDASDVRAAISDADAEDAFRHAFDEAVSARLTGTPGALLSGGLDSSSITVTARVLRPEAPLPTFTIVYDDPSADERRYVDAVASLAGVEPVRLQGEDLSLWAGLDDELRAVGEPFFTPNLFLTRTLYATASHQGLQAILDGFAGDNVVGHGDRWLTELALGLRWPTFLREARAAARRTKHPRRALLGLVHQYAVSPLLAPVRRAPRPSPFLHPDLVPRLPRDPSHVRDRDLHVADLSGPTLPRAFEVAYACGAALGIEPRFPFADRRLVELCLALPPHQRVRDGLTRSILRRAMGSRLPDILRVRAGKARLGGNFEHALFERDPDRLRHLIDADVPNAAAYLDVHAVRDAYHRGVADPGARAEVALPLWRALSLARWLSLPTEAPDMDSSNA